MMAEKRFYMLDVSSKSCCFSQHQLRDYSKGSIYIHVLREPRVSFPSWTREKYRRIAILEYSATLGMSSVIRDGN